MATPERKIVLTGNRLDIVEDVSARAIGSPSAFTVALEQLGTAAGFTYDTTADVQWLSHDLHQLENREKVSFKWVFRDGVQAAYECDTAHCVMVFWRVNSARDDDELDNFMHDHLAMRTRSVPVVFVVLGTEGLMNATKEDLRRRYPGCHFFDVLDEEDEEEEEDTLKEIYRQAMRLALLGVNEWRRMLILAKDSPDMERFRELEKALYTPSTMLNLRALPADALWDPRGMLREFYLVKSEVANQKARPVGSGGFASVVRVKLVRSPSSTAHASEVLAMKRFNQLLNYHHEVAMLKEIDARRQQHALITSLYFVRMIGAFSVDMHVPPKELFEAPPHSGADAQLVGFALMELVPWPTLHNAVTRGLAALRSSDPKLQQRWGRVPLLDMPERVVKTLLERSGGGGIANEKLVQAVRAVQAIEQDYAGFFVQLLGAVKFLHNEVRVCHRDLTVNNILCRQWGACPWLPAPLLARDELPMQLLQEWGPVLIDFGIAQKHGKRMEDAMHGWMPPGPMQPPERTLLASLNTATTTFDIYMLGELMTWCALHFAFRGSGDAQTSVASLFAFGAAPRVEQIDGLKEGNDVLSASELDALGPSLNVLQKLLAGGEVLSLPDDEETRRKRVMHLAAAAWAFEWRLPSPETPLMTSIEKARQAIAVSMQKHTVLGAHFPNGGGVFTALAAKNVNPHLIKLLRAMTAFEPKKRPQTIERIVEHSPFARAVREARSGALNLTLLWVCDTFGPMTEREFTYREDILPALCRSVLRQRRAAAAAAHPRRYVGQAGYEWAKTIPEMVLESVTIVEAKIARYTSMTAVETFRARGPVIAFLNFTLEESFRRFRADCTAASEDEEDTKQEREHPLSPLCVVMMDHSPIAGGTPRRTDDGFPHAWLDIHASNPVPFTTWLANTPDLFDRRYYPLPPTQQQQQPSTQRRRGTRRR